MDLLVFGRVLWRFRVLVALGLVLSLSLALYSMARFELRDGRPHLSYRQAEIWQASTRFLLTQEGFPEGRTVFQASEGEAAPYVDPGRLAYLGVFYSKLANGDAVQSQMFSDGSLRGGMSAMPVLDEASGDRLPFVDVVGTAASPAEAILISKRGAAVFARHIVRHQEAAEIRPSQRVQLEVVNSAAGASLAQGRKKTRPVFVFLAVMTATFGLIFVLENMRPSPRLTIASPVSTLPPRESRESEASGQ